MELFDRLATLAERARDLQDTVQTEEGTKNGLILPFIRALGYDPFDPKEVNPEYTVDVGVRKHEKVDYAICADGVATILVECKSVGAGISEQSRNQSRFSSYQKESVNARTSSTRFKDEDDGAAKECSPGTD